MLSIRPSHCLPFAQGPRPADTGGRDGAVPQNQRSSGFFETDAGAPQIQAEPLEANWRIRTYLWKVNSDGAV